MKFQNLKGTVDYYNEDMKLRRQIEDTLRESFIKYGFSEASTPILNTMDLLGFKYGGGSEILKEVYTLSDQGQRDLGLRYDLTVPFAKMVSLDQNLKMPYRRFEIGQVFRNGPVKAGRFREFIQADVDVVGIKSLWAEMDFLLMIKDVFEKLNVKIEVQLNDRMLLFALLKLAGISDELRSQAILVLDKALKLRRKDLLLEFEEKGIESEKAEYLLELITLPFEELEMKITKEIKDTDILEGVIRFKNIIELLDSLELSEIVNLNFGLARGLEVYTGTIWEVFARDSNITSSIGAGGRYDKLIESFIDNGKAYPTVGMTFGFDVIYTVMKEQAMEAEWQDIIFVIPFKGCELEALKLSNKLRASGKNVIMEMKGLKVGKAMNYANKLKYQYVVVVGEDEVKSGEYQIKNMVSCEITKLKMQEHY